MQARNLGRIIDVDLLLAQSTLGARGERTSAAAKTHVDEVLDARIHGLPPEMHALVRSMLTVPEASDAMRDYLDERTANLAQALPGIDAEARAAMTVCAILGLTIGKHFLKLSAFDDLTDVELSRVARAWIPADGRENGDAAASDK